MANVGGVLNLQQMSRRTIRGPINPMDRCTIVSIYNKAITETKPTIEPGIFSIGAGTLEKPAVLVVGPSSWWKNLDDEQQYLEIPNGSIQIAESFVKDFCNGLLCANITDTMPGLFYVMGVETSKSVLEKYPEEVAKANTKQRAWYKALTDLADGLWVASNNHPLVIAEDMRIAARELGTEHDWMENSNAFNKIRCVACGSLRDPRFPICGSCHTVVDIELARKLNLGLTEGEVTTAKK